MIVIAAPAQNPAANSAQTPAAPQTSSVDPRGQKLVLKDGSFQLVREYQVNGDRIRYYSLDTHQWEEMPAALIDWDATKKEAAKQAQQAGSLVKAVNEREKEENAQPLSVDASIEPAPGIFLPPDNGLFAFDGEKILVVSQADMKSSVSKVRAIEKVVIPVPLVPSRHVISIAGKRAKLRLTVAQPEFYLRSATSGEPEIDLVRAKVKGNEREVENIDELMGETSEKRKDVALQRWQLAPNVYRYTVAKPLEPGEYVLVQNIPNDQYSIYLWDFAIDQPH
ncbi:MAG TPA: hypothetical protein VJS43_11790 [Candidatus Acidoferrales bacterium]|nr:hypothetical protein [Candidatus Acidoferrales bacterium]